MIEVESAGQLATGRSAGVETISISPVDTWQAASSDGWGSVSKEVAAGGVSGAVSSGEKGASGSSGRGGMISTAGSAWGKRLRRV
jgi:hypothetical protein